MASAGERHEIRPGTRSGGDTMDAGLEGLLGGLLGGSGSKGGLGGMLGGGGGGGNPARRHAPPGCRRHADRRRAEQAHGRYAVGRSRGQGQIMDLRRRNKPISPDEVKQVVDPAHIDDIAKQAGVSHDEAAALIATTLPEVVNHVTPDGSLPDPATVDQKLGAIGATSH